MSALQASYAVILYFYNLPKPVSGLQASGSDISKDTFVLLAKGDVDAFRQVFQYYTARLHPFIYSIVKSQSVAQEIVQEVFLKLWDKRTDVAQKDDPSSWLFTVAANASYSYLRKMASEKKFMAYVMQHMDTEMPVNPTDDLLLTKEGESLLWEAVEALPPQRRIIFQLSRKEGLSRQEIANRLGISPDTVKNQLGSAVRTVNEYIRKAGGLFLLSLLLLIIAIPLALQYWC